MNIDHPRKELLRGLTSLISSFELQSGSFPTRLKFRVFGLGQKAGGGGGEGGKGGRGK